MRKLLNKGFVKLIETVIPGFPELEHAIFQFRIKCPLFVAAYFSELNLGTLSAVRDPGEPEFYIPARFTAKDSPDFLSDAESNKLFSKYENFYTWNHNFYKKLLAEGINEVQARLVLPQGTYTEFHWTVNAAELSRFLRHGRASKVPEISEYSAALFDYLREKMPDVAAALK